MAAGEAKPVSVTVNGKAFEAKPNETVLHLLLRNGLKVPHFCYHPKLSIAGVCRMCLVEIEGSRKLEISCSIPVRDGMVVHTESPKVHQGRQQVMEFTLINHPLDCPICDQAGECWLQEYYMAHDRKESQMKEEKVHKNKAKVIGPRVMLDQERCILCTRCVRFCDEVTKTSEIGIFNRGDRSILDVAPGRELTNDYSENVVDICPVGALTSRDFRFDGRVWFLKETPSICTGCSRGCNVMLQHRDGTIRRILPRVNEDVNGYFMCDAGRDIYKEVHSEVRISSPFVQKDGRLDVATWPIAMQQVVERIRQFQDTHGAKSVLGMASVRESNENNLALCDFLENVFGRCFVSAADLHPKTWAEDAILKKADRSPNRAGAEKVVEDVCSKGALSFVDVRNFAKVLDEGRIKGLVVLEQDLLEGTSADERKQLEKRLKNLDLLIVLSSRLHETAKMAHVVFPTSSFAEQAGTFVNFEGRAQTFSKAIPAYGESLAAAIIFQGMTDQMRTSKTGHRGKSTSPASGADQEASQNI